MPILLTQILQIFAEWDFNDVINLFYLKSATYRV